MAGQGYVVGIDFGTLSGRAVVVRVARRRRARLRRARVRARRHRASVCRPPASRSRRSGRCRTPRTTARCCATPSRRRWRRRASTRRRSIGIATDFTASTPMPVTRDGTPLCQVPGFEDRPHAWPKLWKHHAAQRQADRINARRRGARRAVAARYGGRISSEWEFAKALQVLEEDPEVYDAADRWVEGADWIVWQLCGDETRNACTAGYKAIHQDGELPVARVPGGARRALRRVRRRQDRWPAARSSARAPATSPPRPRAGPACPRGSRWRSATSTRTSPPRPRRRSSPARCSRSWARRPAT